MGLLFLFGAALLASAQTELQIASPQLTAGDLAREVSLFAGAPPSAVLVRAPAPGASRRVTKVEMLRWAQRLNLAGDDLPDALILRRRMRTLTQAEVRDAVAVAHRLDPASVTLDELDLASTNVPAGDITLECACPRLKLNARSPLTLRWREPAGRSGTVALNASLSVIGTWLETTFGYRAGDDLQPNTLIERTGPLTSLKPRLTARDLDAHWVFLRPVAAGQPLTTDLLRETPLVSRGDLVELHFTTGAVRLRTPGRAEGSGSAGDILAFRNIATGQRITARLENSRTAIVEVALATR